MRRFFNGWLMGFLTGLCLSVASVGWPLREAAVDLKTAASELREAVCEIKSLFRSDKP